MAYKPQLGSIVRPLGHPTDLVKAKSSENASQVPGKLVIYNYTNLEYELPPTGVLTAQSTDFGVITNTNINDRAGVREIYKAHGSEVLVTVKAQTAIKPGGEVIFSEVVAGDVDAADGAGGDKGTSKVCGKMVCLATEFWKDGINNTFSDAAQNDLIIIQLYSSTGTTTPV